MPRGDKEGTQEVENALANLDLCAITEEASGSTTFAKVVFNGVDKFAIILDAISIGDLGFGPKEDDSRGGAVVNSWGVGVDDVSGNGFGASGDVKGGVGSPVGTPEQGPSR